MDQAVASISHTGFHAQRARPRKPAPTSLIDALADRFYIDQQGTLISNGLSTEMVFFPGDLAPDKKDFLTRKIRNAIQYASTFNDVEELNAIIEITTKTSAFKDYTALGLYLYLADECSRLRPDTTFLTAMRQAGATLKPDQKITRNELLDKTMDALKILGMEASHGAILKEWAATGNFTVQGHLNGNDGKECVGAYVKLARDICMQQTYIGMNLPISYALGNKRKIRSMTAVEVYDFTDKLTAEQVTTPPHPYIRQAIAIGNTTREQRIREIINSELRPQWKEQQHQLQAANEGTNFLTRQILQKLQDPALEILYREGYDCAYTNNASIRGIFPKKDLPGTRHTKNESYRDSRGFREGRYRAIFLSPGPRPDSQDIERDGELQATVVAQTLMHEVTHVALGYMSEEERKPLKDAIHNLDMEIEAKAQANQLPGYFNATTKTIPYRTLKQILRTGSDYYKNYDDANKWEEVTCNLSGLMHSEFPYPPAPQSINPYADLKTLAPLAERINEAFALALTRCRETYHTIEMPSQSQETGPLGRS
jgi:hypothetical protein